MNNDVMINLILIILGIFLGFLYFIYIMYDERKKWKKVKYYKEQISYELDYTKYFDMVRLQKKVIRSKYIELFFLTLLVKLKEIFIWK